MENKIVGVKGNWSLRSWFSWALAANGKVSTWKWLLCLLPRLAKDQMSPKRWNFKLPLGRPRTHWNVSIWSQHLEIARFKAALVCSLPLLLRMCPLDRDLWKVIWCLGHSFHQVWVGLYYAMDFILDSLGEGHNAKNLALNFIDRFANILCSFTHPMPTCPSQTPPHTHFKYFLCKERCDVWQNTIYGSWLSLL